MQKNYILLRNDLQTGPYCLEEIIQFNLKPYDLIWIEGKSTGWYYPQEIAALHPYLSFLPQKPKPVVQSTTAPAEKKAFVAMPAASKIEKPQTITPLPEQPVFVPQDTHKAFEPVSKNLEDEVFAQFREPVVEKEIFAATSFAIQKKKGSARSVGVAIATVLVVGGVFAASWVMNRHSDEEASNETVAATPVQNEIANPAIAANDNTQNKQPISATKQKKEKSSLATKQKSIALKQSSLPKEDREPAVNNPANKTNDNGAAAPANEEPTVKKEEPSSPAETTTAPQEKKKKLRDKIFDIFRKKSDEPKTEEAKPAETENGERRSTRREDGSSLAQMVSIRFDVPNDWMMGIKGAKAILVNRSNQTVSKAMVEILYYDDDNNLLQKKTVIFSKVDAKESKTVSIPDHSSATRVDYSIVSVEGKPAA